jgi:hypothetical protein
MKSEEEEEEEEEEDQMPGPWVGKCRVRSKGREGGCSGKASPV